MRVLAGVALALACPALASAQQAALDPGKSSDQVQRYLNALTGCDTAVLRDILEPGVSSFGVRGGFSQSKPIFIAVFDQQCRAGTKLSFKADILRHEEFGDISLSALELHGSTTAGGQTIPGDLRVTILLRRNAQDGVWRVVHTQTATAF